MKNIEESVVLAMDGRDAKLYPYLPYILQDIWELGASPEIIIELIKKYKKNHSDLKILDLGSGKGAVTIKIANEFKCSCYGIDAIKEFVEESKIKSKEYNVEKYCKFDFGDIRTIQLNTTRYDIIILGAIGPVFGDYLATLSKLKKHLTKNGLIIIDDSYLDESKKHLSSLIEKKSSIISQISQAGMKIIDEEIISKEEIKKSNMLIYNYIKKRCEELIKKEPNNKELFDNYIQDQEDENEVLEKEVICSTIVIGNS